MAAIPAVLRGRDTGLCETPSFADRLTWSINTTRSAAKIRHNPAGLESFSSDRIRALRENRCATRSRPVLEIHVRISARPIALIFDGLQDDRGGTVGCARSARWSRSPTTGGDRASQADWTTRYDYDLLDNVVLITDSQGNRKRAAFDGLEPQGTGCRSESGRRQPIRYDAASNLIETVDAKKQRITYDIRRRQSPRGRAIITTRAPRLRRRPRYRLGQTATPDVRYAYDRSPVEAELADEPPRSPLRNTLGRLALDKRSLRREPRLSYDPSRPRRMAGE